MTRDIEDMHLAWHASNTAMADRVYATMCIYQFPAVVVSGLLNISPTRIVERRPAGVRADGVQVAERPDGWFLSSERSVASLDIRDHLDWLLERVEPSAVALRRLQAEPGVQMRVLCTHWYYTMSVGRIILGPRQMARLAALNLEYEMKALYYPD